MERSLQFPLLPLEVQKDILEGIELEKTLIDANRELITHFEQKTRGTHARI